MARLRTIPSRLNPVPARLRAAPATTGSGRFKHLYRTARWQRLRMDVLVQGNFTCAMCGLLSDRDMVCDHVNGHPATETEQQFWAGPFQVLCKPCHDSAKQKQDAAARAR